MVEGIGEALAGDCGCELEETEAGGVGPALEGMKEGVVAEVDAAIVVLGNEDEEV